MTTLKETGVTTWGKLRELSLPRDGGMLGGVCTTFDEATIIPAWMWRVGFCAAVLAWGTGVVAYFVLMLCIPTETREEN